jgi:hypothetical protein
MTCGRSWPKASRQARPSTGAGVRSGTGRRVPKPSDGGNELDASHGLQGQHHRIEPPRDHCITQGCFQTGALREPVLDRALVLVKGKVLPGAGKRTATQPATVCLAPVCAAGIANAMREQERFQSLPCVSQILAGSPPRARSRNASSSIPGTYTADRSPARSEPQLDGITPVGLYAFARLAGD